MTVNAKTKVKKGAEIVATIDGKPLNLPATPQEARRVELLDIIAGVIEKPSVNVEKIRALLDMRREEEAAAKRVAYIAAMTLTQNEMEPVVRKAENKHTKSKYAKLEKIDEAIRPIYTKHGFNLEFNSRQMDADAVLILCECSHRDGHSKHFELAGKLDMSGAQGTANKTSIQGLGSSVSYLRRYLTCMIFNVTLTDEDNDGNKDKEGKPVDKFADKAQAEAKSHKPEPLPTTEEGLRQAATVLRQQLKAAKDKPARDVIVAANLKLMRALDEKGLKDIVKRLHEIIDGTNTGEGNE